MLCFIGFYFLPLSGPFQISSHYDVAINALAFPSTYTPLPASEHGSHTCTKVTGVKFILMMGAALPTSVPGPGEQHTLRS